MTQTLDTGLPIALDLSDGCTVRFTAISTTTGDEDTGVVISNASLFVDNLGGGDLSAGFADMEPLFVPVPAGD